MALVMTIFIGCMLPDKIIAASPFGVHQASVNKSEYEHNGYSDAQEARVGWTRPGLYAFWSLVQVSLENPVFNFQALDAEYGAIPDSMSVIANIAPDGNSFSQWTETDSWLPVDQEAYSRFVSAVVERYDGDGIDDAPDVVAKIKNWQVANEPGLPQNVRADYDKLLTITYEAIKQACAECNVAIGGVTGDPFNYIHTFDTYYVPILQKLEGKPFDLFDIHWYGNAIGDYRFLDRRTGEDIVTAIRTTLDELGLLEGTGFIITEMGSYSGDPEEPFYDFQSERQQAADYAKRIITAASRGFDTVLLAWGLMEGFLGNDTYFDHTGLIYDGLGSDDLGLGAKKLSYYTLHNVNTLLENIDMTSVTAATFPNTPDSIRTYQAHIEEKTVYVIWWDDALEPELEHQTLLLDGLANGNAVITHLVPDTETGLEVTQETLLPVTTESISTGKLELTLKPNDPIIVHLTTNSITQNTSLLPILHFILDSVSVQ
ncbi:hypothetical protein [Desulfovibrio inopinatus]|uniref:hypothetical protein n=1 Tax=Desulfovibrio inopinatus TaxID=102109 RepID=UPI0003FB2EAD|nr:hypothetical protein [Desulfovibrio inopinatus]